MAKRTGKKEPIYAEFFSQTTTVSIKLRLCCPP